jgi:hypothetical protein
MATSETTRRIPSSPGASSPAGTASPALGLTLRVPPVAATRPGVPARAPAPAPRAEPGAGLTRPMPLTQPMLLTQPMPLTQPMQLGATRPPVPAPTLSWQVHAGPGQQVILMPGQMSFSTANAQLRTLLGSCVAITVWHPGRRIGGMCHFLLPQRQRKQRRAALDGKYGDEAVAAMVEAAAHGHPAVGVRRPPVRRRRHHARGQCGAASMSASATSNRAGR